MMKVRDLKKWCENKQDDDVVVFCTYSPSSEAYTNSVNCALRLRRPRKDDFSHKDCRYCEAITIKDDERLYCNYKKDVIDKYRINSSCDCFEHMNEDVKMCLECGYGNCYPNYRCNRLKEE